MQKFERKTITSWSPAVILCKFSVFFEFFTSAWKTKIIIKYETEKRSKKTYKKFLFSNCFTCVKFNELLELEKHIKTWRQSRYFGNRIKRHNLIVSCVSVLQEGVERCLKFCYQFASLLLSHHAFQLGILAFMRAKM